MNVLVTAVYRGLWLSHLRDTLGAVNGKVIWASVAQSI